MIRSSDDLEKASPGKTYLRYFTLRTSTTPASAGSQTTNTAFQAAQLAVVGGSPRPQGDRPAQTILRIDLRDYQWTAGVGNDSR